MARRLCYNVVQRQSHSGRPREPDETDLTVPLPLWSQCVRVLYPWLLMLLLPLLLAAPARAQPEVRLLLSAQEYEWIGGQIFRNECNAREACLVHWNRGESFPSLGIGHFIWYPIGREGPFQESFPALVLFGLDQGVAMPEWLPPQASEGAPWPTRDTFLEAEGYDPRIDELRQWLGRNPGFQAAFMVTRAQEALEQVIAASSRPSDTRRKLKALAASPGGVYALVDYVNFKGEGLSETERYQGMGWGLLQVLEGMDDASMGTQPLGAFRESAERVLTRRAHHADQAIEREQWLPGWLNRLHTYREPDGR